MATITLDYDARSVNARRTLDYILSMGFFKAQSVEKQRKQIQAVADSTLDSPPFSESFGMWADRDIDIKAIRQKKRERRTKSYDNAAL